MDTEPTTTIEYVVQTRWKGSHDFGIGWCDFPPDSGYASMVDAIAICKKEQATDGTFEYRVVKRTEEEAI